MYAFVYLRCASQSLKIPCAETRYFGTLHTLAKFIHIRITATKK